MPLSMTRGRTPSGANVGNRSAEQQTISSAARTSSRAEAARSGSIALW